MKAVNKIKKNEEKIIKKLVSEFKGLSPEQVKYLIWDQDIFECTVEEVGIELDCGLGDDDTLYELSTKLLTKSLKKLGYKSNNIENILND